MSSKQKMVVVVTNGVDDERASVAWSVANGGVGMGFEVTMFLVSSGTDWARKGAAEKARPNPLDPTIGEMMNNVVESGGKLLVCPPCAAVRGYTEETLVHGAVLAGSPLLGEEIMAAIEALPEVFRLTILLVNVDGLRYDEAAEVLGVPPGTVRSRMKRGRTLLQKALWERGRDGGLLSGDGVRS